MRELSEEGMMTIELRDELRDNEILNNYSSISHEESVMRGGRSVE